MKKLLTLLLGGILLSSCAHRTPLYSQHALDHTKDSLMVLTVLLIPYTHCNAVSLGDGYFLTVKHCVNSVGPIFIGGQLAKLAYTSDRAYVVYVEGVDRPPIPMRRFNTVKVGDPVMSAGYITQNDIDEDPIWIFGRVVGIKTQTTEWDPEEVAKPELVTLNNFIGGMSGGPVLDQEGYLVGLINAGGAPNYIYQELGFALSLEEIGPVLEQLAEFHASQRADAGADRVPEPPDWYTGAAREPSVEPPHDRQ